MLDAVQQLFDDATLRAALTHYAMLGASHPDVWQDRLMRMEGTTSADLTNLHGLLLANGWIIQNLGGATSPKSGVVASCYQVTPAGQRALRQVAHGRHRSNSNSGDAA